MPKMNGYQVCRARTEDTGLKDVPVVLMSAKGDQVGERFVKVMGIVDYITKPFSPEALAAVVSHTIEKYHGGAPASSDGATKADTDPGAEFDDDAEDRTETRRAAAVAPSRKGRVRAPGSERLAALREAVARAAAADDFLGDDVGERLRSVLTDEVLRQALETSLGKTDPGVDFAAMSVGGVV